MNIDEEIARLQAQKNELESKKREAARNAWAKFSPKFDWRIIPNGPLFSINCKYSAESSEEYAAIKREFGERISSGKSDNWHGMNYVISRCGRLVQAGGGSVIIITDDSASRSVKLTEAEIAMIETGQVPDRIKKPW